MQDEIERRITELEAKHGSAESCGWHEELEYHYDMEVAAAINELRRLSALIQHSSVDKCPISYVNMCPHEREE